MVEIIRCNDPVLLSWVEALLRDAGIDAVILDQHTTSVWGESLSAVSRRLLVPDDDAEAARQLLEAANLGNQLRI